VQTMTSLPLDTPVYDDQVRFVCMSDTHCKAAYFSAVLPPGDVFLHAGDFTDLGRPHEVEEFNAFLGNSQHCLCCLFTQFLLHFLATNNLVVLCKCSTFPIESNSYFNIRFETSTIIKNFRILTVTDFLLI